jgi:hypothetical protein
MGLKKRGLSLEEVNITHPHPNVSEKYTYRPSKAFGSYRKAKRHCTVPFAMIFLVQTSFAFSRESEIYQDNSCSEKNNS